MPLTSPDRTDSVLSGTSQLLDRRLHTHARRLFIGGERSVRRALVTRTLLVLAMFLAVVLVFWLDRDGLRDHADNHISFADVVYFSVVTVTTVGYGDIVPVTKRARVTDALIVTPIRLFICTDRDDTNVLITLTARHLSGDVRIVARVEEAENEKLVRQSGADATVLPSRVGGLLMADSLESSAVASAVMDLISAGGHITLVERAARPDEVGRMPAEIVDSLVVRVLRDAQELAFWQQDARIRADDRLVVIRPV